MEQRLRPLNGSKKGGIIENGDSDKCHTKSYWFNQTESRWFDLKDSPEAKKLLISEDSDSHNLFHRMKNNELKTKLHECFMGKLNEFTITLDAQPYFFLFHRSYNGESLE